MGLFTGAIRFPGNHAQPVAAHTAVSNPSDANHLFANNVRFLSMAAVIAEHAISVYPKLHHLDAPPLAMLCLVQLLKFGTIAFFLVAGFLFGERIDQYSSLQYYGRRLKNVLLPWVVWYVCYCGLRIGTDVVHGLVSFHSPGAFRYLFAECVSGGLLGTPYWFVPNLLIALAVLLIFRRVLRDVRVGAAFAVVSLLYAANIYGQWIPVQHSRAVLGFVFYLWLGAWASWHFATVNKWLARIPAVVMLSLIALAIVLAIGEAKMLVSLQSADPMNTLRITNQVFSVLVVLAIMKLRHAAWPRFVDVRRHTFGLYLTHPIGLAAIKQLLPVIAAAAFWGTPIGAALSLPIAFIITYGGCLLVVRTLLACPWLRWTVGLAGAKDSATARRAHQGENLAIRRPLSSGLPLETTETLVPLSPLR
ncbi:MAG TPA: acyltransferase [Acidobacteriaceae bacterium]|jgi:peptidoglycan/LPS O-acetylase OafA/YrhL